MPVLTASILLFLVMDPFGNIPIFLCTLRNVPAPRRLRIVVREMGIALGVLLAFVFAGPHILTVLQISPPALRISGGIILFLIALKMVFGGSDQLFTDTFEGEPYIVPLAIPCVAGPSTLATLLFLVGQEPGRWAAWVLALIIAWFANLVILVSSTRLSAYMGRRELCAAERLMGLLLTAISVEMVVRGILSAISKP